MTSTVSLGKQCFHRLPDQFITTIPEQFCQLAIDQLDASTGINNEDAIWVGFKKCFSLPGQGFRRRNRGS